MIKMSKPLSATMLVLALVFGLGSVVLFAGVPLGALAVVSPRWSLTTVLLWDVALSMLFFLQHSGMIRRPFRAWLARIIDPRYRAAVYGIASGIALAAVFFAKNIQRTSPGRQMVAVRDNDLAAEVMGISLFRTKLLAFFLGCFYAGIAGWLMAHNLRYLHPNIFSFALSLSMLGMVIVGGMGSTSGAVLGAVAIGLVDKLVYYVAPEVSKVVPAAYASSIGPALQLIVFGLVVMAFLLLEPRGIQHRVEKIKLYYRLRPFSY